MTTSLLKGLNISGCAYVSDNCISADVYHVGTPHALTRAAGYLKFELGKNKQDSPSCRIFFRGQSRLYESLTPTLYRGLKKPSAHELAIREMKEAIKSIITASRKNECSIFDKFPAEAQEPLLQHYGLKTRWIDVVDNVWVALWFACYDMKLSDEYHSFAHFERRSINHDDSQYAYIILISTDTGSMDTDCPGLFKGNNTQYIDLRIATPSIFLRPHAQHALLFRAKDDGGQVVVDFRNRIAGIIRINLRDALSWLCEGQMIGDHAFFPPPFYDIGYRYLLGSNFEGNDKIGHIHYIGP